MPPPLIRQAYHTDLPALTEIDLASWGPENSPAKLAADREFTMAIEHTWVATDANAGLLGYLCLGLRTQLASSAHVFSIQAIAVAQSARRRGVGTALIDFAKAEARRQNGQKLTLNVLDSNASALAFYLKNGFSVEAHFRREFCIQGTLVGDRALWLDLSPPPARWCTGSCHCGNIGIQVFVRDWRVLDCNCTVCTKKGILHLIVGHDDFRLLRGADSLSTYTFATHTAKHHFCARCGMHAYYVPRSHPHDIDVNVRCLDDAALSLFGVSPFDGKNWDSAARERGYST